MESHILDNLQAIKKVDANDIVGITLELPKQFEKGWELGSTVSLDGVEKNGIKNIIIAGMGGSGVGGDILAGWLRSEIEIPITVVKDYNLPQFASKDTLLFILSYSGNTEETLSAFQEGVACGCRIVSITSGGKLEELSKERNIPVIKIPKGFPPRTTIGYSLTTMASVLERMDLLHANGKKDIDSAAKLLEMMGRELGPEALQETNIAKRIAIQINGAIPVVYASQNHAAAANRWHAQLNENSKILSWFGAFPELNHNEVVGWSQDGKLNEYCVILLTDSRDNERVRKRMSLTRNIFFKGKVGNSIEVEARGETTLERMLSLIYVGDFASIYLAVLRGIDPTPVDSIEEFKKKLG